MSDLVERLRGRRISASLRNDRTGELEMRDIQDLLAVEAADRIEALEGIVLEALPILDGYEDCGPSGETWQSDELMVLVAKARAALGE